MHAAEKTLSTIQVFNNNNSYHSSSCHVYKNTLSLVQIGTVKQHEIGSEIIDR